MTTDLNKKRFYFGFLGTMLLAFLMVTGSLLSYSKASGSYFLTRAIFRYYLFKDARELEDQSHAGYSSVYYFTSYYLNGLLSAVEGTGDEHLMRRTMHYIDTMIDTAQDITVHDHHYRVWRPFLVTADSAIPKPNMHYSFQACVPIARAAAIIEANPYYRIRYSAEKARYVAFVDSSIFDYWIRGQFKNEIPWVNPDHFPIWNDNGCNLGICATYLYRATGNPRYKDIALQMGRHFQSKLIPFGPGWVWESQTITLGSDTDNTPGSVGNQAGVPDTSHTNREALLMVSQHESGLLFTDADLDRMAATFVDTLWNQNWKNPEFSNYLNGSDKPYRVYKSPGLNGSIYHGWALMGGYSPEVQKILLATLDAIEHGRAKKNSALERNSTSYGANVALTGHILRNYALDWTRHPQSGWDDFWRSDTRDFFVPPTYSTQTIDTSKS